MTNSRETHWLRDIVGLDVDVERQSAVIGAYRDILVELNKLRALDLTDVHPAVIFSPIPSSPYHEAVVPIATPTPAPPGEAR